MAKKMIQVAATALCAAAFLAGGCTEGSSISPANVSGRWTGPLTLSYGNGGSTSGSLDMALEQQGDFASGIATWVPKDTTRSVTAEIEGNLLKLSLHFRCAETDPLSTAPVRAEIAVLTGTLSNSTLSFTTASGFACPNDGAGKDVVGAAGSFSRTSNTLPL